VEKNGERRKKKEAKIKKKEKKKRVKMAKAFRHPLDLGILCPTSSSGALHLSLHYSGVDLNPYSQPDGEVERI
jgi:hypothetical protein